MASKSKQHLRYQPRKSVSRSTQAFTVLILLLVVILILLGLGILSLPNANRNSSKTNDLTNIVRKRLGQFFRSGFLFLIWKFWFFFIDLVFFWKLFC